MKNLNIYDWTTLTLVIIGGLNWGLVGIFKFDLVAAIFGDMGIISRVIYALVGVAAVYLVVMAMSLKKQSS